MNDSKGAKRGVFEARGIRILTFFSPKLKRCVFTAPENDASSRHIIPSPPPPYKHSMADVERGPDEASALISKKTDEPMYVLSGASVRGLPLDKRG